MCGIVAIYRNKGIGDSQKSLIQKMSQAIVHRGPDDCGYYYSEKLAMAHRRLSIIDTSELGKQPMPYKDRYELIFNGEIYNYLELKEDLKKKGYSFNTNTDSEVIMAAYDCYGIECFSKFNGMWALIMYDKNENILVVSRDRYGVKPLYYYKTEGYFLLASEIKALLCDIDIKRVANDKIVYDYLVDGYLDHTDETFFNGIRKFPASSYMVLDLARPNEWKFEKFYDVTFCNEIDGYASLEMETGKFREIFDDSIRKRLRADVDVGSCLSGGLDSSSIVTHVYEMRTKKDVCQHTFSFCSEEKEHSERMYVDEVLNGKNINAHIISDEIPEIKNKLDLMIGIQDEPFGSLSIYASYLVYASASQSNIKVLLDGQGADEILCGYRKSNIYYIKQLIKNRKYLRAVGECIFNFPAIMSARLTKDDFRKMKRIIFGNSSLKMTSSIYNDGFISQIRKKNQFRSGGFQDIDFWHISLPQLLRYADHNSMSSSVESRLPFLDYRLVDFCAKLPISYKIKNGFSKYIMRKSLDMPELIRKRRNKMGFSIPELTWIKGDETRFKELFSSKEFLSRRFVNNEEVVRNWTSFMNKQNIRKLFRLICLL